MTTSRTVIVIRKRRFRALARNLFEIIVSYAIVIGMAWLFLLSTH